MLIFALAVFFLLITPGPGVLSTAGVGAAFGVRPGARYVMGLWMGTNLVALAVVTGLAAAMLADPRLRVLLYGASILYLVYIAARIALAGSQIAFISRASPPGLMGGIALQAINPKAYVFNTSLFSGFAFWESAPLAEMAAKFVIINLIWLPIHFLWLWVGIRVNALNLPPRTQRAINMTMAGLMLAVVALATLFPPGR